MQIKLGKSTAPVLEIVGHYAQKENENDVFSGKEQEVLVLPSLKKELPHRVYVGCGEPEKVTAQVMRVCFAQAWQKAKGYAKSQVQVLLPPMEQEQAASLAAAAAQGISLAGYAFAGYHKEASESAPVEVWLDFSEESVCSVELDDIQNAVEEALRVARAMNTVRPLVQRAPNDIYPETLAAFARRQGETYGIEVKVLEPEQMQALGMNGLLCVGRGTPHAPRLIVMRYRGAQDAPVFGLVGKGITCDTGGYCIKGKDSMPYIKGDMAGAATVMAVISAAAANKCKVNLTAVIPTAENVIDGDSYKPGDVITMMNRMTVEVLNTDCEGRMILADAITYLLEQEQASSCIDIATLTGLAGSTFGSLYTPVFASDEHFYNDFCCAAKNASEDFWRMPLDERYQSYVKGDIADLKNMAGAGTISAAVFLQQFTQGKPWIHLDIAATAIQYPVVHPYAQDAPSGVAVRTIYEMLKQIEDKAGENK